MKKVLILFTSIICYLPLSAHTKHGINVGIGGLSRPFAKDAMKFKQVSGAGGHDIKSFGAYHLGYQYNVSPTLSIGFTVVYEHLNHEISPGSSHPRDDWERKIYADKQYTALASLHNSWFRNTWITLHSGAAAGVNLTDRKETRNDFGYVEPYDQFHFAYQLTPIGIKVGKQFYGYVELGYGFKGFICSGIGYRF